MAFTKHHFKTVSALISGLAVTTAILIEAGCSKPPGAGPSQTIASTGDTPAPVRMMRISEITGKVSWRPDETTGWTAATLNMPLRQGTEFWLAPQSRLEIQFDDGSTARFGNGAVAAVQTLYSDKDGEFTELKLTSGTSSWTLKNKDSIYQIDCPCDSVKSTGPSTFRVDINPKTGAVAETDSVAVRKGKASLTANGKETPIPEGQDAIMSSQTDPVVTKSVGPEDNWDHYSDNRDAILDSPPAHVPSDIALVSGGLDQDGTWHDDPVAGWVWTPTAVEVGWRPYHHGHWAWVDPYGWTWVSSERWGWAPYHYGTWAHFGFGWGWAPGPAVQYWSPARVDFVENAGVVSWVPLAPEEVVYPAFSVGFGGPDWYASFSIGGCGVYEPFGPAVCDPVVYPWGGYYGPDRRDGWGPHGWGQDRFAYNTTAFVPRNAVFGAVSVSSAGFAAGIGFSAVSRDVSPSFRNGRQDVANRMAFSGPVGVRPGATAFSANRMIVSNGRPAGLDRAVVRGALPENVARNSGSFGRTSGAIAARGVAGQIPGSVAAARQQLGVRGAGTGPVISRGAAGNVGSFGRTGTPRAVTNTAVRGIAAGATANRTTARTRRGGVAAGTRNRTVAAGTGMRNRGTASGTRAGTSGTRGRTATGGKSTARSNSGATRTRTNRQTGNRGHVNPPTRQSGTRNNSAAGRGRQAPPTHQNTRGTGGRSSGGGRTTGGGNRGGQSTGGGRATGGGRSAGGGTGKKNGHDD